MGPSVHQGRIVWVELLDPQGRNPKVRPAVVLTPTAEIRPGGEVVVAAVSRQVDQSPPEVSVPLPWQRGGHPRTRLNSPNVVVCTWLVAIPVSAIGEDGIGGVVPFREMARILDVVSSLRGGPGNPPPDPPTTS